MTADCRSLQRHTASNRLPLEQGHRTLSSYWISLGLGVFQNLDARCLSSTVRPCLCHLWHDKHHPGSAVVKFLVFLIAVAPNRLKSAVMMRRFNPFLWDKPQVGRFTAPRNARHPWLLETHLSCTQVIYTTNCPHPSAQHVLKGPLLPIPLPAPVHPPTQPRTAQPRWRSIDQAALAAAQTD